MQKNITPFVLAGLALANVAFASTYSGTLMVPGTNTITAPATPLIPVTPVTPVTPPSGGGGGSSGGGGGGFGGASIASTAIKLALGNLKGRGVIDEYDLSIMMANWGRTGVNVADLNNDQVVNEYDFAILMANWSR